MKIKFSRPLRIVFLACNKNVHRFREDPSYIYRCENLGAALADAGHDVRYEHVSRVSWYDDIDIVVFHRPQRSWYFRLAFAIFRYRGIFMLADVDDLVFNPAQAIFSPGVVNSKVPLDKTKKVFESNLWALAQFDHITVSTVPLAEELQQWVAKGRVLVVPNAVHHQWRTLADESLPLDKRVPVLTYMPGTRSHNRDFAKITGALTGLLNKHPNLQLAITGPLEFDLPARLNQVVHYEKRTFNTYHESVRTGWVNLAPLEASPFTRCKSALKVIEAGYWNIPTVCSPLPDAERFTDAGALIARREEDWVMLIEQLLLKPAFYRRQAEGLRNRMLEQANIHTIAQQWLKFVMEKID